MFAFFGIGPMELLIVAVILAILCVPLLLVVGLVAKFRLPKLGHTMLNCPHCGKDTKLVDGKCQQCGHNL